MAEPIVQGAGEERLEEGRSQETVAEAAGNVSPKSEPSQPIDLSQNPQWRELEAKLQSERDRANERAKKLEEELRAAQAKSREDGAKNQEQTLKLKRKTLLDRGLNPREVEDILEAEAEKLKRMEYERDALYAEASARKIADKIRAEYKSNGIELTEEEVNATSLAGGPQAFEQSLRLRMERKALDKKQKDLEAQMKREREEGENKELTDRRESGADRVTGDHQSDRSSAPQGEEAAFLTAFKAAPSGASRRRVIAEYRKKLGSDRVDQLLFKR